MKKKLLIIFACLVVFNVSLFCETKYTSDDVVKYLETFLNGPGLYIKKIPINYPNNYTQYLMKSNISTIEFCNGSYTIYATSEIKPRIQNSIIISSSSVENIYFDDNQNLIVEY